MNHKLAILGLTALVLAGCAHETGATSSRQYAGKVGSVYDLAANPPEAKGIVTYDTVTPLAPKSFGDSGGGRPSQ